MKAPNRRLPTSSRRRPATQRGIDAQAAILGAARKLLQEHWLDQVPLAQLAKEAGLARASVLFQFPDGWVDVLSTLVIQELDYVDPVWTEALELKRAAPAERVRHVLEPMLLRAEQTGLLFANLRAAMFTWGEENQATFRCGLQDYILMIVECLAYPRPVEVHAVDQRIWIVAEGLYYQTLDLAARPWLRADTWDQRRKALTILIDNAISGLGLTQAAGRRSSS